ncbi:MAG: hypothetical protein ABI551_03210, partial [Polyangiaceae bacterium]
DDTSLAQDQGAPDGGGIDVSTDAPLGDATPPDDGGITPGTPVSDHDQTCAYGGAKTPMTVSCNPGQVITSVTTALYGRFNGSCGEGFTLDAGACNPVDVTGDAGAGKRFLTTAQAVEQLCDGLRSCTFYPDSLPPVTNDPCFGTFKQFSVQVTCGNIADAGADVDGGDPSTGKVLDLDALDLGATAVGADVTSWKNHLANGTAITSGTAPKMATTPDAFQSRVVRFSNGAALKLPQSNSSDPYLIDFHLGLTALVVVAPHGGAIAGEHIFDFGGTMANNQLYFGAAAGSLLGMSHPVDIAPSLNAYGAWNVDYLQLYTYVVRPLPSGVVPNGSTNGATWGSATLYVGELPVAVGFQPLPATGARISNLIGGSNAGGNAPGLFADVGEILIYGRALSAGELQTEQAALETKWHLCDGADTQTDPANCGSCGMLCTAGAKCDFGVCTDVDLSSWSVANPSSGDAGFLLGPADGDGGTHPVSWAQARNTCLVEGTQLGTPVTHDADLVLKGYFDQAPITRERSVGVIREESIPRSAVDLSALSPDWSPYAGGAAASGCTDMKPDGTWTTVSGCNASAPRSWSCEAPFVKLPTATSCPVFTDAPPGNHAYAICPGPFPSETARKQACAAIGGKELVAQSFAQAANVGVLQTGAALGFDLTSARKSPRWTLGDGSVAPFIGWDSTFNPAASIPPFIAGPVCAVLSANGTMTDQSCFASSSVVCALADGTPAPTALPAPSNGIPGFIVMYVSLHDATTPGAGGNGTPLLTGVKPGDTITGLLQMYQVGRNFTLKVGLYPSSYSACQNEFTDPARGQYQYPPLSWTMTAPPLPGVYPLITYPDSDCSPAWNDRFQHGATTIGAIQVVAP